LHTKALAYVPSIPKRGTGGFGSAEAAAAYPLKAVLGTVPLAAATAGLASRKDIIVRAISCKELLYSVLETTRDRRCCEVQAPDCKLADPSF
jgi:hypothetical protein